MDAIRILIADDQTITRSGLKSLLTPAENIEIIGEATKRLSEDFKAEHSQIPWRSMAGMRDILIHAYNHVDLSEVWNTATVAIPTLISYIEPLIPSK